ncbi:hypothetical protein E2562_028439 [Oryza meyeriana var. granulata]|uniref:Uncharacterized protein n=1 Tax=Oryza meyeriana var. granulata TaxID=110450 RepID=A0A6G1E5B8_9ORYZ|nr:hypothetical protein E2562_028439 [Oryza meyeriana var. granulata]
MRLYSRRPSVACSSRSTRTLAEGSTGLPLRPCTDGCEVAAVREKTEARGWPEAVEVDKVADELQTAASAMGIVRRVRLLSRRVQAPPPLWAAASSCQQTKRRYRLRGMEG